MENNEEVARRVGKDTEDLEEKCDVKKEGERENNTILEKELPSCLHYEGILKNIFLKDLFKRRKPFNKEH